MGLNSGYKDEWGFRAMEQGEGSIDGNVLVGDIKGRGILALLT